MVCRRIVTDAQIDGAASILGRQLDRIGRDPVSARTEYLLGATTAVTLPVADAGVTSAQTYATGQHPQKVGSMPNTPHGTFVTAPTRTNACHAHALPQPELTGPSLGGVDKGARA